MSGKVGEFHHRRMSATLQGGQNKCPEQTGEGIEPLRSLYLMFRQGVCCENQEYARQDISKRFKD